MKIGLGIFRNTVLLVTVACIIYACNGSDDGIVNPKPSNSAGFCDLKIEDFILDNQNTALLAYEAFDEVTFKNEAGDRLVFSISASVASRFEGIFEPNDTTDICYAIESTETKLNSSEGFELTFITEPKAYFADLEAAQFADVLKIYFNDTNDMNTDRRIVFRKVIDLKSYPPPLYETTKVIDSKFFVDKEFKGIEITKFNNPIIELYYQDEIGIVAFIDELGVLWQYDSKS